MHVAAGGPAAASMAPWVAVLPERKDLCNAIFFNDIHKRTLAGTCVHMRFRAAVFCIPCLLAARLPTVVTRAAVGTTTEDALDSLPIRKAFVTSVLPFMEGHDDLWPTQVLISAGYSESP